MKLSCLQENLNKALGIVGRVVSTKSALPVLSHVLLKTEEGRLKLQATNLEVGINFWVGGKIDREGEITIPARLLSEFVASLPSNKIELEMKDLSLNIKAGNFESNIKGIDAQEFPLVPELKKEKLTSIPSDLLKEAILLVSFAAAIDDSRPVLSGVYFKLSSNTLTLAATDSYRLAEKTIYLKNKIKDEISIIIPGRSLIELSRILGDISNKEVNIYLNENQILFEIDNVELISRLIEGQFPNYKQIIPESYETRAEIKIEEFLSAVKVASLFARESANSIKIEVKPKGEVVVSATASQVGDNVSKVPSEVEGKEGEIAFNSRYLLDVLGNIKSPKIALETGGKLNPGVIKPTDDKDYLYIIMPLRA